jgi:hypothetical protein
MVSFALRLGGFDKLSLSGIWAECVKPVGISSTTLRLSLSKPGHCLLLHAETIV